MRTDRPLTLSVTEAGNLLGASRSTAYELVRTGELESVQLRRRVVVPVATVPDVWFALDPQGDATARSTFMADLCPTPSSKRSTNMGMRD